jgi:NADPH2:quinone reductase
LAAESQVHPGWEWFTVLTGRARLELGDRVLVVEAGEAGEFSTMVPHRIRAVPESGDLEILSIFNRDGERAHLREYLVLPAAAAVPVPRGWGDEQALGLVVNWPTAIAALRPLGGVSAGQTVLINAAAGGTGQAAVKIAKHYGATVIAAASPGKHDVLRALGADHVVDSRSPTITADVLRLTEGAGADVVLESVGGATFDASLAATKRVTGRIVVYGLAGGEAAVSNWDLVYRHQVHVIGLNIGMMIQAAPHLFGAVMNDLFGLLAAGVLGPGQPTTYALAAGPTALVELENRATVGKLALLP